jgi:predicted RNA-binding protein
MCESNAYLITNGEEELLMESVDYLRQDGENIIMKSIFGEEKSVKAVLKEMSLTGHRILLETPS